MPTHDPSRPKKARRRRTTATATARLEDGLDSPHQSHVPWDLDAEASCAQPVEAAEFHAGVRQSVERWAPLLWTTSTTYSGIFENEAAASTLSIGMRESTYRRRITGEAAEAYDARKDARVRDCAAILRRGHNQRDWSFSVLARSISYFNQRVPAAVWNEECNARRLASRPTCIRLLEAAVACEPPTEYPLQHLVAVFGADQTFKWMGANKNAKGHRGAERVDEQGLPIKIKHLVYVNSIRLRMPATLPSLSAAKVMYLRACKTAYTEDFADIFPYLSTNAVRSAAV